MKDSKIEWTDHTANFWWGCVKVSPGCEQCYAETLSKRYGRAIWGPAKTTERYRTKGPWKDILRWDKQAKAEGVRRRVFCQSMSDFFEEHPQLDQWRNEAYPILEKLEWLDVQLLTKRPENILRMVPASWLVEWPSHIWIGTSVEDQVRADKRIPELLKIPAAVRFLSVEPLLGPVNLSEFQPFIQGHPRPFRRARGILSGYINWVIVGGESGHDARPMHPDWARSLRDQCQEAGVPFLFKQWGHWAEFQDNGPLPANCNYVGLDGTLRAGDAEDERDACMGRVGKKAAGRQLDGREWNEFPQVPTLQEQRVALMTRVWPPKVR